ncbi:M48 family metallopeptidase [Streptosporangium saharense]|uniref:M48 family metallopeptidase n=1 Tax=Streptosporangium saharense TaxID=1706840 RepID=UPI0033263B8E
MTPQPAISVDDRCPSCSAPIPVDPRFVTWCPECDWNADPEAGPPVTPTSWRAKRAARRWERHVAAERAAAERLYTEALRETNPYRRRDGFWPVAMAVAGMVHLITAAVAVGSGWLLVVGPLPVKAVGVAGLVAALFSLPRPYRVRPDEWSPSRTEAPHLYGLADRIAAELGVAPVGIIRFVPALNASFDRVGFRRRGVLNVSLPLWEVLAPQERVALFGHELGHAVRGDIRRSLWFVSAYEAVYRWYGFTDPSTRALLTVPHLLTKLLLLMLYRPVERVSQRAEYRADDLSVKVASSAAALSLMGISTLGADMAALLRRRTAGFDPEEGAALWRELRECVASVPESERLRRLRVSALRPPSEFSFYPPVHLRVRLAGERGVERGSVDFPEREVAAVEAELAAVRDRMAQAVLTVEL